MIHDLRPYPTYKESGAPWLEKVPMHWEVERLKGLAHNVTEQTVERRPGELYIALEHVESWTGVLRKTNSYADFDSQVKRFKADDVLFGKLRPYLAKVTRPALDGVCVGEFFVLRPRGPRLRSDYLEVLLRSKPVIDVISSSTFGAKMPRADWQFVGNLAISLPKPNEQSAIVRFLNHTGNRIRRYTRAKKKLMALLNEQKQVIIHHAVTYGIDHNVRLKPSGVEWLVDIPEHWTVRAFTRCAIERADYRGATPTKTESGVFLVTARNIRKGWIDYQVSKEFVAESEYEKIMQRGLPRVGDLLLTTEAPLGNAALVDREDIALAQRVVRFRFDPREIVPEFMLNSVLSPYFQNQLLCRATGSTALGIKASKLPQLKILLPPLIEQNRILEWVHRECAPLERALERAASEINLLAEYRTRIIADVVTGKLDVRKAVARLPIEGPESSGEPEMLPEGDTEDEAGIDEVPEEAA